ncbi:hypothetical protein D3C78_891070 [compost metagenome]
MDLLTGFNHQRLPDPGMAAAGNLQVVIGLEFDLSVRGDSALVFSLQHRDAVALDGFSTFVTDFQATVVFDLVLQVTLSPQVDQLLAFAVFNRQFVVATAVRRATAAQHGLGFVRGQRVRLRGELVGHATGNQRLVGITLQVGHHHFHADARKSHRTKARPSPAGRHAYPATALVTVQLGAVPMELDFDPAKLIAVDFLAHGPSNPGCLADQHRLAGNQRRAVEHLPRDGAEAVAIALGKAVCRRGAAAGGLLKHLRLFAFMLDTEH